MRADISHSSDRICSDPSRSSHSFALRAGSWIYSWFQVSLSLLNKWHHAIWANEMLYLMHYFFLLPCSITLIKSSFNSVNFFWSSPSFCHVSILNEKILFWGKGRTLSDIFSSWMKLSCRHGEITNVMRGQTSLGHRWKGRRKVQNLGNEPLHLFLPD